MRACGGFVSVWASTACEHSCASKKLIMQEPLMKIRATLQTRSRVI